MPNISKVMNSNGIPYNIKDNGASHYLGRLNSDDTPTTATITLDGESTSITAKINDWIVLQTKSDAFIWNGTEWMPFGGRGTDALVELVDAGAKNLLEVPTTTVTNNGVQFTISDGVITATILSETRADAAIFNIADSLNLKENEEYIFMVGLPSGASSSTYFYDVYDASWANRDVYSITRTLGSSRKRVRLIIAKEYTGVVGTTIIAKPMICPKSMYSISQTYQPYRPSYQELYDEVQAKITKSEVYNRGTAISTGDDLNDYTSFGKFYASTGTIATSLINCPITTGFVMTVEESFQAGKMQTLVTIESGGNATVTYRRSQVYRSNVWSWLPWYKFEGTAVT